MKEIIEQREDGDTSYIKIKYPDLNDIEKLKINFQDNIGNIVFDKLILLSQSIGEMDTNAYFSCIAYMKEDKLFLFTEYDNPEHSSFMREILNEENIYQLNHLVSFYKEAHAITLEDKLEFKLFCKKKKI